MKFSTSSGEDYYSYLENSYEKKKDASTSGVSSEGLHPNGTEPACAESPTQTDPSNLQQKGGNMAHRVPIVTTFHTTKWTKAVLLKAVRRPTTRRRFLRILARNEGSMQTPVPHRD